MRYHLFRFIQKVLVLASVILLFSCGGGSGGSSSGTTPSNNARFTFNCDLNGLNGVLDVDIEAVGTSGIVWGGGPNPQITAVIDAGGVNYFTAGTLDSTTASYIFTGTNEFADFTNQTFPESFRVQWVISNGGLTMIINPFGPGPTVHNCIETSAVYF